MMEYEYKYGFINNIKIINSLISPIIFQIIFRKKNMKEMTCLTCYLSVYNILF